MPVGSYLVGRIRQPRHTNAWGVSNLGAEAFRAQLRRRANRARAVKAERHDDAAVGGILWQEAYRTVAIAIVPIVAGVEARVESVLHAPKVRQVVAHDVAPARPVAVGRQRGRVAAAVRRLVHDVEDAGVAEDCVAVGGTAWPVLPAHATATAKGERV